MTALDLPNIQGFVVRGYRLPVAEYLFLRFDDPVRARTWLAAATEEVITAAEWTEKPRSGINLAFTFAGLAAIGVPDFSLAGFAEEFREGMASRAGILGDTGQDEWESPFAPGDCVHAMVMISAKHDQALAEHAAALRAAIQGIGGIEIVGSQTGRALPEGAEHFGYMDGIAQPAIEGGNRALAGQGAIDGGGWRPIRAGEFILGYDDEEGVLPPAATPAQLSANGTYLVYRKLHQDVARFRQLVERAAALYPGGTEMLFAKVCGRWRDGTPLALSPDAPDPALAKDRARNNAFRYGDDPEGLKCPVGGHIRRVNPRDSLPFEGKLVNRHRLIRRSIPFGPPLEGSIDDGVPRGLVFTTLQASIERQFEFVQSQWLNDGNTFRIGDDQDVMQGSQDGPSPRKMMVPGSPPFLLDGLSQMVTCSGGEYFFVPGINGLRYLVAAG